MNDPCPVRRYVDRVNFNSTTILPMKKPSKHQVQGVVPVIPSWLIHFDICQPACLYSSFLRIFACSVALFISNRHMIINKQIKKKKGPLHTLFNCFHSSSRHLPSMPST